MILLKSIFLTAAIDLSLLLSTKFGSIRAVCGRHCEEHELMSEKIINLRLYYNLIANSLFKILY